MILKLKRLIYWNDFALASHFIRNTLIIHCPFFKGGSAGHRLIANGGIDGRFGDETCS
jgi:hypothetical protein